MIEILNAIINGLGTILQGLLSILPNSPFVTIEGIDNTWLQAINWLLPVSVMIAHLEAFTAVVVTWYGIRIVMRWIKAAGG